MTVAELIQQLQQLPQDAVVVRLRGEHDEHHQTALGAGLVRDVDAAQLSREGQGATWVDGQALLPIAVEIE